MAEKGTEGTFTFALNAKAPRDHLLMTRSVATFLDWVDYPASQASFVQRRILSDNLAGVPAAAPAARLAVTCLAFIKKGTSC